MILNGKRRMERGSMRAAPRNLAPGGTGTVLPALSRTPVFFELRLHTWELLISAIVPDEVLQVHAVRARSVAFPAF